MPMTVSKTREMLVDVARQLFARMGVDNTTKADVRYIRISRVKMKFIWLW